MLKIHKHSSKKLLIIPITSILSIGAFLGICTLTYTPELSHAESVSNKKTLANIEYMQDITPQICANTPEADTSGNNQYQLKDSRDGKTYWVAKLKDGNCWMTQNLDLDLASRKLTTSDSDVSSDWTSTTGASALWTGSSSDYNVVKYYDPGEYAYTKPTDRLSSGCGLLSSDTCKAAGWELMSGASTDSAGSETTHYLAGNYYSYNAATAGTGASITSGSATGSICPKGWQLPTSNNTNSKSFGGLFAAYGTLSGLTAGSQDIRLAPLYFVYNGYVYSSALNHAGNYGYYWSSTVYNYNSAIAYNLNFSTGVDPSSLNGYRYFGFSVRCVASGGEGSADDNVEITVNPTISLDVANEVEVMKSDTNPSTTSLDVKVTSNQGYSIQINAIDHAELTSSTTDVKIPSMSGTLSSNSNAWGIKKPGEDAYAEVTTTAKVFYQSTVAEIKTIPFIIGISTTPDIPNGEYSTDITITATQN